MCTEVRDDGDLAVEYEFPCYNKTSQDSVSWEREPGQWSLYSGVMLRAVTGMGSVLWPRDRSLSRAVDPRPRAGHWGHIHMPVRNC